MRYFPRTSIDFRENTKVKVKYLINYLNFNKTIKVSVTQYPNRLKNDFRKYFLTVDSVTWIFKLSLFNWCTTM